MARVANCEHKAFATDCTRAKLPGGNRSLTIEVKIAALAFVVGVGVTGGMVVGGTVGGAMVGGTVGGGTVGGGTVGGGAILVGIAVKQLIAPPVSTQVLLAGQQ
jgi:hypothetical protein